jgi:hypothetical protein
MTDYFDRARQPISEVDWQLKRCAPDYVQVAKTECPNGQLVSTIWRGEFPGVFETGTFPDCNFQRYETEAEALAGHQKMVEEESK